jgi:hypothetical protein
MFERKMPEKDTPEFQKCIDAINFFSYEELTVFAKSLGFSNAESFMTSMRRLGYSRPQHGSGLKGTVKEDVKAQKLTAELKYFKGLYRQAADELAKHELFSDAIQEVAHIIPAVVVKTAPRYERVIPQDKGTETDVVQVSDLHGGEVVKYEETMGINAYDMTIMNRRLGMMFRKTLELVELRRSSLNIPNLIIAQGGDMLSGDIHEELVRTNVSNMMMLAARVAYIMAQGIGFLSPHFENIYVPCIVGNHPRLSKKPAFKERYYNWDYLCYQWQAVFCKDLLNVRFDVPKAPFMLFNAEKTRIIMLHGDWVRSWMGLPYYGIERALMRLREMLQAQGDYFDVALLYHFHRKAEIPMATGPIFINGSVKGGDEFAMGAMQTTSAPSQNLLYFHSKNGPLGGGPIYLAEADSKPKLQFQDALPDVWADTMKNENNNK